MTVYLFLLLVAVAVAYLAIRVYRSIANTRVPEIKVVALSDGRGNWRLHRQEGFVRPGRTGEKPRVREGSRAVRAGKNQLKKPWGW